MTIRRLLPLIFFTVFVVVASTYMPSGASDGNRVAVVVDYGNGQVAARCVTFSEESITGYDALERTGLPIETDFQTGGAAVCRIDGQGCPSQDCFCSCRGGGECRYWSYWHLNNGIWNYSAAGSGIYRVSDGAVDGWVWGLGSVTEASPPPLINFADVCTTGAQNTPTATSSPTLTTTPIVLPTSESPTGGGAVSTPAMTPSVTIQLDQTAPIVTATTEVGILNTGTLESSPTTPQLGGQPTVIPTESGFLRPTLVDSDALPEIIGGVFESGPFSDLQTPEPLLTTPSSVLTIVVPDNELASGDPDPTMRETAIAELPNDEMHDAVEGMQSGYPVAQSGSSFIIGQGVSVADRTVSSQTQKEGAQPDTSDYWGFAGTLLLLGALSLLVYRRRTLNFGARR